MSFTADLFDLFALSILIGLLITVVIGTLLDLD